MPPATARRTVVLLALACSLPRSPALAQDWSPTGGPSGGFVTACAAGEDALYLGTTSAVYRSTDHGASWTRASGNLPLQFRVASLASAGPSIFAGGTDQGLWRSRDLGRSWSRIDPGLDLPGVLRILPSGASLFVLLSPFASSTTGGTLAVSDDDGDSWRTLSTPEPFTDLDIADGVLLGSGFFGVYRSVNQGLNWQASPVGATAFPFVTAIAVDGSTALAFGALDQQMYLSRDAGRTWAPTATGLPGSINLGTLARVGSSFFAANPTSVTPFAFRSGDGTDPWVAIGPALNAGGAQGTPQAFGGHDHAVLLGTSAGAFRSTDDGATWSDASLGIADTTIVDLATRGDDLYALVISDRRIHRSTNAGRSWTVSPIPGPTHNHARSIAALPNGHLLVGSSAGGIFRSTDAGATWTPASTGIHEYIGLAGTQFREIDRLAAGPGENPVLFAGAGASFERTGREPAGGQGPSLTGGGIFRSNDGGATWHAFNAGYPSIGPDLFGRPLYQPVSALAVIGRTALVSGGGAAINADTDPDLNSGSFLLDLGETTWVQIDDERLPCPSRARFQAFLGVGPEQSIILGATICGGVARLDLDGAEWLPSGTGLPLGVLVTDLAEHNGVVYASLGNSAFNPDHPAGVFASSDLGATWQPVGPALAGRVVHAVAATPAHVFAGTVGAGVWRLDSTCPPDFNADGRLDADDLGDFINCFFAATPCDLADFNTDGSLDADDLGDFINAYFAGCP